MEVTFTLTLAQEYWKCTTMGITLLMIIMSYITPITSNSIGIRRRKIYLGLELIICTEMDPIWAMVITIITITIILILSINSLDTHIFSNNNPMSLVTW